MDPISALGVASAAVAFIDFAITIVGAIHEQCGDGDKLTRHRFQVVINDLVNWGIDLDQEHVAENDSDTRALQYLLSECHATARSFIETLEKLKPKTPDSKWDCFHAALKSQWGEKHLHDLQVHIESFRSQLSLRMLGYINAKLDARHKLQNRHFDALAHQNSQIADILAVHQRQLAGVAGQARTTENAVVEALAILKNGELRSLSMEEGTRPLGVSPARVKSDVEPGVPTYVLSMGNGATSLTGEHEAGNRSFDKIRKAILGWLYFPQIHYRYESVKPSHRRTLDWVYGENTEQTGEQPTFTWSSFATWLRSGSGCYWLRGKAGSGKSTLMKYLFQDERTITHLREWSDGRRLLMPGFFFWYLGTTLQKSQAGLIRALLYILIQQWPPLILEIMPEVCVPYAREGVLFQEEPAVETLWNWFRKLQEVRSQLSICIFIDGLDEYVGDHSAMAEVFLDMAKSCPSLKFVVSSRPINSCLDAFENCPNLRLESLNRADIRTYTEDKLSPRFEVYGRSNFTDLAEEIVVKSEGVFLWVHLVVLSLLKGLRDGDTTSELSARLSALPSDLEQLYQHMFDRIPTDYQPQASRIFQLILARDRVLDRLLGDRRQSLSALQFSYAIDDEDDDRQPDAGPTTNLMQAQRVAFTDARIRSRCFGLVEVVYRNHDGSLIMHPEVPSFFDAQDSRFHSVEYMHRTAFEFLSQPSVEAKLHAFLGGQAFDPWKRLFRSCVALARVSAPLAVLQSDVDDVILWGRLLEGLLYAKEAEEKGQPLGLPELELLDAAYSWQWESSELYYKKTKETWVSSRREGHWFRRIPERGQRPQRRQVPHFHLHDTNISFTDTIARLRYDDSLWQFQRVRDHMPYDVPYRNAIGDEMLAFLEDETLNLSRVAIMFGLNSCLVEQFPPQPGVADDATKDKATKLLQFLVLGISGTVVGLEHFMATSGAPICEILLSAGADPNSRWVGPEGGTLWTRLLFYYAMRIEENRDTPDTEIIQEFVKYGADLTASVVFKGESLLPIDLIRSLLMAFHKFADELTQLMELTEASMTSSRPIQITVTEPSEQANVPQLSSTSPTASLSGTDAILVEGGSPVAASSSGRASPSSLRSAISKSSGEYERQKISRKARLFQKIFKS